MCIVQVDLHCQAQGALLRDAWAAGSAMTNGLTQRLVSQHAAATQRYAQQRMFRLGIWMFGSMI